MDSSQTQWVVRPVEPTDEAGWKTLFRGYREFYKYEPDEHVVDEVWKWTQSPDRETHAFVAVDSDNNVVGIANVRKFPRNLVAGTALWLDDLFTTPELRGQGIARSLLSSLKTYASENGFNAVRWITAKDNAQARILYDDVADETVWVTYDLKLVN